LGLATKLCDALSIKGHSKQFASHSELLSNPKMSNDGLKSIIIPKKRKPFASDGREKSMRREVSAKNAKVA